MRKRPALGGQGDRPHKGVGVHSGSFRAPRSTPSLRGGSKERPGAGHGQGVHQLTVRSSLHEYFASLCERLRYVRVCCGDWSRVLTPAATTSHGITGVLLDPPYALTTGRKKNLYAKDDDGDISSSVRAWAIEHGDDPLMRIVLCGLEGEHVMPDSWTCVPWKPGVAFRTTDLERLWLSPHCLHAGNQLALLDVR